MVRTLLMSMITRTRYHSITRVYYLEERGGLPGDAERGSLGGRVSRREHLIRHNNEEISLISLANGVGRSAIVSPRERELHPSLRCRGCRGVSPPARTWLPQFADNTTRCRYSRVESNSVLLVSSVVAFPPLAVPPAWQGLRRLVSPCKATSYFSHVTSGPRHSRGYRSRAGCRARDQPCRNSRALFPSGRGGWDWENYPPRDIARGMIIDISTRRADTAAGFIGGRAEYDRINA